MSKKKIDKREMDGIGELIVKLSVDKEQFDIDLDRIIKRLNKIKRLFNIIDLKKKVGDLISYLRIKKSSDKSIKIENSINLDREYIQDKVVPEIIDALKKTGIDLKNIRGKQ
jgi:poly-gamma-glutamate capsule biosynthesis protein CapA/YwtB (metallophosphatase superfamily)